MKRQAILLLSAVLLLIGGAAAQSTKEQTLRDIRRTGALYYIYDDTPRAAMTPAPDGYEPFYISHYGRHGSRWHASKTVYRHPRKVLQEAHDAGNLTPLGEDLYARVVRIADDAEGRYGDLSPRGVREHRGIAERMYHSFPEVFSTADGRVCNIRARSTTVPRCILSMAAANERLKELNPALRITRESSDHYKGYMAHYPASTANAKEIRAHVNELRKKYEHPDRLIRSLFKRKPRFKDEMEAISFMTELYSMASIMQGIDGMEDCSLYDIFTQEELYTLYALRSYLMYLEVGPSAQYGDEALGDAVPLLRNFVEEADAAMAAGTPAASLRYGHDVFVIPLVALMGIENCDARESDFEKVDAVWSCWRVSPMATNIQWIFYRRPGSDEVLVKFLFNERESRIRLDSDLAPYYRWDDVKRYFEERIATQTAR